jgi:microcompartment protein CcmL/EutN
MALGILETRGFSAAIEALDAMCKDARVSVKQIKRPGGGHITLLAEGEVAAVLSAVEAGVSAASRIGGDIICSHVIPNPHPELSAYLS